MGENDDFAVGFRLEPLEDLHLDGHGLRRTEHMFGSKLGNPVKNIILIFLLTLAITGVPSRLNAGLTRCARVESEFELFDTLARLSRVVDLTTLLASSTVLILPSRLEGESGQAFLAVEMKTIGDHGILRRLKTVVAKTAAGQLLPFGTLVQALETLSEAECSAKAATQASIVVVRTLRKSLPIVPR